MHQGGQFCQRETWEAALEEARKLVAEYTEAREPLSRHMSKSYGDSETSGDCMRVRE